MENLNSVVMEQLAEAAQGVDGRKTEGRMEIRAGNGQAKKIHSCLVPYNQLSEADKESDRDMVRGIPKILAAAGYKMVKAD